MVGVSEKVVSLMVENEIISSEDKEIYIYGLKQGFILLINIISTLFVGFVFNQSLETIFFLVTYIPLRIYAGGYHARTQLRCYISSIVLIIAVLLVIKYIPWTNFACLMISTISALIIFILSPVEDMNKPLDAAELKMYGEKTRMILVLECSMLILLMVFEIRSMAICVTVTLFIQSFMLILGKLK